MIWTLDVTPNSGEPLVHRQVTATTSCSAPGAAARCAITLDRPQYTERWRTQPSAEWLRMDDAAVAAENRKLDGVQLGFSRDVSGELRDFAAPKEGAALTGWPLAWLGRSLAVSPPSQPPTVGVRWRVRAALPKESSDASFDAAYEIVAVDAEGYSVKLDARIEEVVPARLAAGGPSPITHSLVFEGVLRVRHGELVASGGSLRGRPAAGDHGSSYSSFALVLSLQP